MLAARFGSQKDLWRTIGLIVAIRITESQQAAVTDAQQRCSVGVQALSPVLRQVREQLGFVRFAVPVLVDQDLDIARTSNDDATLRIDRHRVDVVRQIVSGELDDLEALGNFQSQVVGNQSVCG
jgi:hypothetical protein